jgi:hypothetical protein
MAFMQLDVSGKEWWSEVDGDSMGIGVILP